MKLISSKKGMTLVEILFALLLLGIVIVPLGKFFIDSFKFQSRSQKIVQANKTAEYVIETFKSGQLLEYIDGGVYENLTTDDLGISSNVEYFIDIESEKVTKENEIEYDILDWPDQYDGVIIIEDSAINYDGDIDIDIDNFEILINDGAGENNLKVENNGANIETIDLRNLSGEKINVYKDNDVIVNVLEGNIFQVNLGKNQGNSRYILYKVKVTVTEKNDDTISTTVETTLRALK